MTHYSIASSKSSRESFGWDKEDEILFVVQDVPTNVILPVDSSPHSEYCLVFYIRHIHKIGNKVHVIFVSEDFNNVEDQTDESKNSNKICCCRDKNLANFAKNVKRAITDTSSSKVVFGVGASPGVLAELERKDRAKCNEIKYKVKKFFRANGVLFEFNRIRSNDIAKAIVRYTNEAGGDMVVMGSRGLGGLKRLIGSVSEKVLKHSDVPVLIVNNEVNCEKDTQIS